MNRPQLSTDKLDDYAWTGLKTILISLTGGIIALPFDITIYIIRSGYLSLGIESTNFLVVGGLAIISIMIRLMAIGYSAKWLYNWE